MNLSVGQASRLPRSAEPPGRTARADALAGQAGRPSYFMGVRIPGPFVIRIQEFVISWTVSS